MGKTGTRLILASASPRRRSLLEQIGLTFRIRPSEVEECHHLRGDAPTLACCLALEKARWVACREKEGLVIGADTVVVLDGEILGKPRDHAEAFNMLVELAGRTHQVVTGVALVEVMSRRERVGYQETAVTMRPPEPDRLWAYVATSEPIGKAGAYAVQGKGALLVERIEGCYSNVVGLPLGLLTDMLREFGVDPLK